MVNVLWHDTILVNTGKWRISEVLTVAHLLTLLLCSLLPADSSISSTMYFISFIECGKPILHIRFTFIAFTNCNNVTQFITEKRNTWLSAEWEALLIYPKRLHLIGRFSEMLSPDWSFLRNAWTWLDVSLKCLILMDQFFPTRHD